MLLCFTSAIFYSFRFSEPLCTPSIQKVQFLPSVSSSGLLLVGVGFPMGEYSRCGNVAFPGKVLAGFSGALSEAAAIPLPGMHSYFAFLSGPCGSQD